MRHHSITLALMLTACSVPQIGHAGRPLQTEDAGIIDAGGCELESFAGRTRAGGVTSREASVRVGCGVGGSTQLAVAAGRERDDGSHTQVAELAGKTRLWTGPAPKDGDAPGLTLAYVLDAAKASGQAWKHSGTALSLVYSRLMADAVTLHANLGHARDEQARSRSTTWGLAAEHAPIGGVAPMVELFGDDRAAPWWNLGLRWSAVPERLFIDASYGRQIAPQHPSLVTVGFKLTF